MSKPKEELRNGYIKISYSLAPTTNGKKFATWCEEYGFTPLNGGRRAWHPELATYLRGADGVAFADGEMFLFYEEDLVSPTNAILQEVLDESKNKSELLARVTINDPIGVEEVKAIPLSEVRLILMNKMKK